MAQTRSRWREGEETCGVEKERRSADDKAPVGPAHMDGKQSTAGGEMLRSTVNSASLDRRGSSEARLLSSGVVTQFYLGQRATNVVIQSFVALLSDIMI